MLQSTVHCALGIAACVLLVGCADSRGADEREDLLYIHGRIHIIPAVRLENILLATEEQSDSVICLKSHRKYVLSLKKQIIIQSISDYGSGLLLAAKGRVLRDNKIWILLILMSSLGSK